MIEIILIIALAIAFAWLFYLDNSISRISASLSKVARAADAAIARLQRQINDMQNDNAPITYDESLIEDEEPDNDFIQSLG